MLVVSVAAVPVVAAAAVLGAAVAPAPAFAGASLAEPRAARLAAALVVAASAAAVAQSPEVDSVVDTAAGLAARAAQVLAVSPVAVVARNAWPARVALPDGAVVAVSGLAVALPHGVAVVK